MSGKKFTITLFSVPRGFDEGEHVVRQMNALNSWVRLDPRPEIILLGDDPGVVRIAQEFGCVHEPGVQCDDRGVPLLSSVFVHANRLTSNDLVAFVNTDIILFQDFVTAVKAVNKEFNRFLMVGRRRVVDITKPLEFSVGWGQRLQQRIKGPDDISAIDYFVLKRDMLLGIGMLPFSVGSPGWDNWLMARAIEIGIPTIDATHDVFCIHHYHEKAWPEHGIKRNRQLAQGKSSLITKSLWKLQDGKLLLRDPVATAPSVIKSPISPPIIKPPHPLDWIQSVRNYCTYLDSEHLIQFLVMYESMVKWCKPFKLWTLALDEPVLTLLHKLKLEYVGLLPTFYKSNQNLRQMKMHRSSEGYTRTLKPLLLQHVMKLDIDSVIYLNTNGYFLNYPNSLYKEIAVFNIAITPHRFGAGQGEFNAGFMYFRKGEKRTFDCIVKWCDQVMTKCENSPGYFYEQKYLESWPKQWGAHAIQHKGVNLAPWNQGRGQYKYEMRGVPSRYHLYVDNDPLVWYNFSRSSDYRIDDLIRQKVYEPYKGAIQRAKSLVP